MAEHISMRARWVIPVDGPPLSDGVVEVADGKIAAVHAAPGAVDVDLGNVALLPGLVNAHTHLEFSDLPAPLQPALPFTDWIRALVAVRRTRDSQAASAIPLGQREAGTTGTTLLGEIATSEVTEHTYQAGPRVVAFREIIGLTADRHAAQLEIARAHLATPAADSIAVRGLSPHAPYSVRPELFRALVGLAHEQGAPVAMHLAETRAELELLERGTGEFVELLQRFGVWDPQAIPPGTRPLDYLRELRELDHALVVHGNYLRREEQQFLGNHPQVAVVYCPRTHAYFQHAPHPWREILALGGKVAIGTDSRGSNPDLNLWNEVRYLRRQFPDIPPAELIRLGTLAGAEALGLAEECGSLTPGKRADLAVAYLPAQEGDVWKLVFDGQIAADETICHE